MKKSGCIRQPIPLHRVQIILPANVIDSLFALICNISDTDFIDNEVKFDISRLDVLEFLASLNKFEYKEDPTPLPFFQYNQLALRKRISLNIKGNIFC